MHPGGVGYEQRGVGIERNEARAKKTVVSLKLNRHSGQNRTKSASEQGESDNKS